jgi:hypothetical protein
MRLLLALLVLPAVGAAEIVNFDSAQPGSAPAGWTVAMTHTGGAPKWEILNDPSAPSKPNVLAQTSSDPTDGRFPLAIFDKASFQDGELSVGCKAISGRVDQGAGLVWRYRDPNNYYLVRANALEGNVVLYKVQNGRRSSIAPKGTAAGTYGVNHKVPSKTWNTLRVTFNGPLFTVYFNGEKLCERCVQAFAHDPAISIANFIHPVRICARLSRCSQAVDDEDTRAGDGD